MQGHLERTEPRTVSFQSGKEVRWRWYWPGQVFPDEMIRDVRSVRRSDRFASSLPSFFSLWPARNRGAFALWITEACAYTHIGQTHRVECNEREKKEKMGRSRDWKEGKRNDQESEQQVASRSKGWRNRCRAAHSRPSSSTTYRKRTARRKRRWNHAEDGRNGEREIGLTHVYKYIYIYISPGYVTRLICC